MTFICPLCNGIEIELYALNCPTCNNKMVDSGRVMDYFDDYSAYLEIEGMKKFDGIEDDAKNHQCPHLFVCPSCGHDKNQMISEVYIS
ncbi:hypothetical protein [Ammoniphilus sp. CFH 90114]|uniref:hypothetical protein n=1 Tax=Ammoniphilus sp. CFH 90114 TaxID=2493665 RepID=UPI001010089D|nr:hypothetical protein [Ammoniphilus sp. CFH 90114]RXT14958.1 hypothetical protein EIZ39_01750 [Ammoniphilus sp. CFH 90114]